MNSDIIAFVNGTETPEVEATLASNRGDNWKDQLNAWNVTIDNRTITSIDRLQDGGKNRDIEHDRQFDKFRVNFSTGEPVERNALMTNFGTSQASSLPSDMGLDMDSGKIKVGAGMRASQSGVFAVGDANNEGSTNVPHAMFSGKRAAVYLHGKSNLTEPTTYLRMFFNTPLQLNYLVKRLHPRCPSVPTCLVVSSRRRPCVLLETIWPMNGILPRVTSELFGHELYNLLAM